MTINNGSEPIKTLVGGSYPYTNGRPSTTGYAYRDITLPEAVRVQYLSYLDENGLEQFVNVNSPLRINTGDAVDGVIYPYERYYEAVGGPVYNGSEFNPLMDKITVRLPSYVGVVDVYYDGGVLENVFAAMTNQVFDITGLEDGSTMALGQVSNLTVVPNTDPGAYTISWTSSDSSVVSVSPNGRITVLKAASGTGDTTPAVTIKATVTVGDVSTSNTISIMAVEGYSADKTELDLSGTAPSASFKLTMHGSLTVFPQETTFEYDKSVLAVEYSATGVYTVRLLNVVTGTYEIKVPRGPVITVTVS